MSLQQSWCFMNKPSFPAGTDPQLMHLLSPEQSARRTLGLVLLRAFVLSNHSTHTSQISPECLMGKKLSPFLYQFQTEGFFAPLFCALTDKLWRVQSGMKDILCRAVVCKDKIRINKKGRRRLKTHWNRPSSVHTATRITFNTLSWKW